MIAGETTDIVIVSVDYEQVATVRKIGNVVERLLLVELSVFKIAVAVI